MYFPIKYTVGNNTGFKGILVYVVHKLCRAEGEVRWGSGFVFMHPYPHILNISNGEKGPLVLPNR
jgi:hypothetical protein